MDIIISYVSGCHQELDKEYENSLPLRESYWKTEF